MSISAPLIAEMKQEGEITRKVLERVPESAWEWKPHEKSMTMLRLATHVAEMFGWTKETLEKPELDFAAMDYKPFAPGSSKELLEFFDKHLAESIESLKKTSDEAFMQNWKLRNGEQIYFDMPRIQVVRGMVLNHIIHHRGQLSVYLRLQNVPVPAMYGPSADEGAM